MPVAVPRRLDALERDVVRAHAGAVAALGVALVGVVRQFAVGGVLVAVTLGGAAEEDGHPHAEQRSQGWRAGRHDGDVGFDNGEGDGHVVEWVLAVGRAVKELDDAVESDRADNGDTVDIKG